MKDLVRGGVPAVSRDRKKWAALAELPYRDAQTEQVQHLAAALRTAANGNKLRFVMLAFALARDCVRFVSDTSRVGHEDIAGVTRQYGDPLEVLERGTDDCDGKARLLVAILLAGGLGARMVPWWDRKTGDLAHVSAEVLLGTTWRNLETILSRARLGDEPDAIPVEPGTGKWAYS